MEKEKWNWKIAVKPAALLIGLSIAFALWRLTPLKEWVTLDNLQTLSRIADELGWIAYPVFAIYYIVGTVLLVPGSFLSLSAGLTFGVVQGMVMISLCSVLGASSSFLIARYLARPFVESLLVHRPFFKKLDDGVAKHGWRMVATVRLVPVFPYMFVNYALGLTRIRFWTHFFVTWVTMLPASLALSMAGGSVVSGGDDWKRIFLYLLLGGLFLAFLSFLPLLLKNKLAPQLAELTDEDGEKN
jgi:uncharacterized membrane protein YdjX (TVP38/TMEM64 family)